jgi:GntR family transcriptional regulator
VSILLYKKIENDIKEKIRNNLYKPGDKLPSEIDLMVYYQASKMTVRRSISNLEREGILYSIERVGNYVATNESDEYRLTFDGLEDIKGVDEIKLHRVERLDTEEEDAMRHKTSSGYSILVRRYLLSEGKVVAYNKKYFFNLEVQASRNEEDHQFYKKLNRQLSSRALKTELIFEAIHCPMDLQLILKIDGQEPLARVTLLYYDRDDHLIARSQTYALKEYVELNGYSV